MTVQALDRLTPEEHRLLSHGRLLIHDWTNVAPGTPGSVFRALVHRGLMRFQGRDLESMSSAYTVTRAGRDLYVSYGAPYVPITDILGAPLSQGHESGE